MKKAICSIVLSSLLACTVYSQKLNGVENYVLNDKDSIGEKRYRNYYKDYPLYTFKSTDLAELKRELKNIMSKNNLILSEKDFLGPDCLVYFKYFLAGNKKKYLWVYELVYYNGVGKLSIYLNENYTCSLFKMECGEGKAVTATIEKIR
jgi:hypothetical protein